MKAPVYRGPIPREQRYYAAMQRGLGAVMELADEELAEAKAAAAGYRSRSEEWRSAALAEKRRSDRRAAWIFKLQTECARLAERLAEYEDGPVRLDLEAPSVPAG